MAELAEPVAQCRVVGDESLQPLDIALAGDGRAGAWQRPISTTLSWLTPAQDESVEST